MLTTTGDIAFTSPLAAALSDKQAVSLYEIAGSVGLADLSGQAIWHVRGREAANALKATPSGVGDVIEIADGLIAQPRGDQYFLLNTRPKIVSSSDCDSVLTVTDMTHGYGHLLLIGQDAAQVLSKICGLNFADAAFPNHHIAQSSLAKVRASIIRHDRDTLTAYHILVAYPIAEYVWDVVFDAMQEFDGKYIEL